MSDHEHEEVVTDFGKILLRSKLRIVEETPGSIRIEIDGPDFEFDDEEDEDE